MTKPTISPSFRTTALPAILAVVLALCAPPLALADGGTVILYRDAGPFTVTLFAPGVPLHTGATDLSVLVQERAGGEVLFDPGVTLTATQPGAHAAPVAATLSHAMAANQLLQAANVRFSRPGKWRIALNVRRGEQTATLNTEVTVEPNRSRAYMVWFYLLLPLAFILLFVAHQTLKGRQGTAHV